MHDMMKHLNMNMALHPERVNIYILPFHGLMGQSTVNIAMCLCHDGCIPTIIFYEVLNLQCTANNTL